MIDVFFCDRQIHGPDNGGRRVDRHRCRDAAERNLMEERFHIGERTDGHTAFAHFTFGKRMIRVVTHQGGKVEGDRNAVLSLREKVSKAPVGVLGGAEARELAHGPQAGAIHRWMDPACKGRGARNA